MEISKLQKQLKEKKKIVITTHQKPDADALGSSLALLSYLRKNGHQVHVITPTDYPEFLFWMEGNSEVIIYTEKKELSASLMSDADYIYCLDFSQLGRINELGELVRNSSAVKILIDHHQEPEDFAAYELWDTKASSTAELIYDYISLNNDLDLIDKGISECIYAGIVTDTGSFRFPSTSKHVHLIIADLMEKGLDHSKVHSLVYDDNTESRLRLLGYFLSEKLVVLPELHTAYFTITEEELNRFNYKTGDTEGIVNYALSMRGIVFAGIFMEKEDMIKISLRSVGSFSAAEFSRINFCGGGHYNAAGGKSDDSLQETEQRFLKLVSEQHENLKLAFNNSLT